MVDHSETKRLIDFAAKAAETFVSAYYAATDAPHRAQVGERRLRKKDPAERKIRHLPHRLLNAADTDIILARCYNRMEWSPNQWIDKFNRFAQ